MVNDSLRDTPHFRHRSSSCVENYRHTVGVMSAVSGISNIGIQAINGKTGTSQRSRPRDPEEGHDSDSGEGADTETDMPMPQPPGVGRLIDKIA